MRVRVNKTYTLPHYMFFEVAVCVCYVCVHCERACIYPSRTDARTFFRLLPSLSFFLLLPPSSSFFLLLPPSSSGKITTGGGTSISKESALMIAKSADRISKIEDPRARKCFNFTGLLLNP